MKLSFADERVLAVMAHPDDAELLCAGTLARAKADGGVAGICVMCRGDKGAAAGEQGGAELGHARKNEAAEAARLLGATLYWFGAGDGELFDHYENRKRLIEVYRQYRPTLVIAHGGEDYHPDHRAAHVLAEAASWLASSRGHVTESAALESAPGLWVADTVNMSGFEPEFYIDVTKEWEKKEKMLACHESQLARGKDGDFSPLGELMECQSRTRGQQAGVLRAEAFRWQKSFKRIRAW